MANTPNVEHIWLSLPDTGEDGVLGSNHNVAVITGEVYAISPRDLQFAV